MSKTIFTVAIAAGLIAATMPALSQSAAAQTAAPAVAAETKATTKTRKPPRAATIALRERQKKCGAEWKVAKAAGKVDAGMKWPKFWSACNKRLKATSG